MFVLQRITGVLAAAILAAGPVLSCCSQAFAAPASQSSEISLAQTAAMAGMEGCEEDADPAPGHDPNCAGCPECFAAPSAKSLTLAAPAALAADAPQVIAISWPLAPGKEAIASGRRRLTPPANGPPLTATPVSLKNTLRL